MKDSQKIVKYHLDLSNPTDDAFMKEVNRIKVSGRRLSDNEKALLLQKAKTVVYKNK